MINMKKNSFILLITTLFFLVLFLLCSHFQLGNNVLLIAYILYYTFYSISLLNMCENRLLNVKFLFFIFFSVFVGLSPIALYLYNNILYIEQLPIIALSIFMYMIPICIFGKKGKKDDKKTFEINYNYVKQFSNILLVLSLVAYALYFVRNRSLLFSGNLESDRISALSGNGIILQMMNFSVLGLALLFECFLKDKYSLKKFIILCCIFLPLTLLRGFRSGIISPILIFFFMYNKAHKISNRVTIKFGIYLIALVTILGELRTVMSSGTADILTTLIGTFRTGSINMSHIFRNFGTYIPFQYGYSYLVNMKMLLPGADPDFTLWLKELMKINFSGGGITPTIIGEFYLNFGIIGVYIGMFLMGIIVRKINDYYDSNNTIFYPSYLVYACVVCVSGGIANVEIGLLIFSVVYYCIYFLSTRKVVIS